MRNTPFQPPVKIVTFFNNTDMEFTGQWAKTEYHLMPGEKMKMEDWKARHLAKHLFDQWCFANGKDNRRKEDFAVRKMAEFIIDEGKSLAMTEGEVSKLRTELLAGDEKAEYPKESDQDVAARMTTRKFCDSCDSKGVVHKKDCPKRVKKNADAQAVA